MRNDLRFEMGSLIYNLYITCCYHGGGPRRHDNRPTSALSRLANILFAGDDATGGGSSRH